MNRIDQRFQALSESHTAAFIPYIVAGDPDLAATVDIVAALEKAGADIIELGVPFSDPVADGIPNQEGALRALNAGATLHKVIDTVKDIRKSSQIPLLLFTYFNPILAYGLEDFANDAAASGVDGVLCVDLPPDEATEYCSHMRAKGLCTVFLVAPTTPPDRMKMIVDMSTGFIYYVSRTGVTGERDAMLASVRDKVGDVKAMTDTPVAVGFGISSPAQAGEVAEYADGVVVGSAIVRFIGEHGRDAGFAAKLLGFVKPLADAAKGLKAGSAS